MQVDRSANRATSLFCCTHAGIGLLSIPYALSQGGWSSLAIFLTIAIICNYTDILLQRCMDASPLVTITYPDIGALAFGKRGRLAVATFMYIPRALPRGRRLPHPRR